MQLRTQTKTYVRRLVRTAAELSLHPFFLDALVSQLLAEKECSQQDFLQAYFLRLSYWATEKAHKDLQSASPAIRVRAAARLSRASLLQIGHLSKAQLDLLARCKTNSQEHDPFTRLHLEVLNTACDDLEKQMTRCKATSFTAFLREKLGPNLAGLCRLRYRMEQLPATDTGGAPGNNLSVSLTGEPLQPANPHPPVTLMLADGMTMIREAMKELLIRHPHNGFTVIGEAATGRELMALLKNARPDVVIIDVNTPQPNGIDTTAHLRQHYPNIKVLALSHYKSPVEVELMVRAGATGFIGTNASVEELFYAIRTVSAGGVFFGKGVPTQLLAGEVASLASAE